MPQEEWVPLMQITLYWLMSYKQHWVESKTTFLNVRGEIVLLYHPRDTVVLKIISNVLTMTTYCPVSVKKCKPFYSHYKYFLQFTVHQHKCFYLNCCQSISVHSFPLYIYTGLLICNQKLKLLWKPQGFTSTCNHKYKGDHHHLFIHSSGSRNPVYCWLPTSSF